MKIMSILSPINEKVPEKDLGGLLKEVLCSEGKAIKIEFHLNSCNLLWKFFLRFLWYLILPDQNYLKHFGLQLSRISCFIIDALTSNHVDKLCFYVTIKQLFSIQLWGL